MKVIEERPPLLPIARRHLVVAATTSQSSECPASSPGPRGWRRTGATSSTRWTPWATCRRGAGTRGPTWRRIRETQAASAARGVPSWRTRSVSTRSRCACRRARFGARIRTSFWCSVASARRWRTPAAWKAWTRSVRRRSSAGPPTAVAARRRSRTGPRVSDGRRTSWRPSTPARRRSISHGPARRCSRICRLSARRPFPAWCPMWSPGGWPTASASGARTSWWTRRARRAWLRRSRRCAVCSRVRRTSR